MTFVAAGGQYEVPPEPSRWSAMALAAAVHAGLMLFLWIGIQWQSTEPVAVEAEVWSVQTEMAAPTPPPPPAEVQPEPRPEPEPAPPPKVEEPIAKAPPDIALEREKKRKEELKKAEELAKQEKLEKEKLDKIEKEKLAKEKQAKEKAEKLAKAEADSLKKSRDAELRRISEAMSGTGSAARSTAPKSDPGYIASLTAKIKGNIIYGGDRDVAGDPRAVYRIEQLPTGEIIGFKKIKSSGIPEYDRAVEQAITASSPLPKKKDGTVERSIEPIFKLKD